MPTKLLPMANLDAAACCVPLTGDVIATEDAEQLAYRFKALGDPTRVRLLSLIAAHDGREACICDLTEPVGLSQPTVSHHMKQLADAGLVTREQRGKWAYYRIVDDALTSLATAITPR
jgi:ArsR family transcriptional regulator, arsenate/arsenite/antimonite-responsive transcriptional repressor